MSGRNVSLWRMAAALLGTFCSACVANVYDVCDFGAVGDGETLCTAAIQEAIDRCSADGGGTVRLRSGTYLSGTIVMKSGVTLHLHSGSVLRGSTDLRHYPEKIPAYRSYTDNYTNKSLIYAERRQGIALVGRGTIDGQGGAFSGPYKARPYTIRLVECRDVVVEQITIRNSPMWVQHYLACEDVRIAGVTVKSHVNHNNDGIDIDSCQRVIITGCNIDSGDDAIVLKSTSNRPCSDVVVSGCVLRSACNALKMGTESNGGFRNIVMIGCAIHDTALAGVALEIVDGGTMDRIVVSDIAMSGVGTPIFLRLGNRARPFAEGTDKPGLGAMKNITIANIEATATDPTGCAIAGVPDAKIENVTLSNVRITFPGGGTLQQASRLVPENAEKYPEHNMFGRLPAYGFYIRHIQGLKLSNVQLQRIAEDGRHALVLEDVRNAVVDGLDAPYSNGAAALLRLTDVRDVAIRGCAPGDGTEVFVRLEGRDSGGIALLTNDLRRVEKIAQLADGLTEAALSSAGNLGD